jgi:hypothetical protein
MKNSLPFPDGFEQWMLEKSWEQLNSDELKFLAAEGIDAAEYAAIRNMLIELQQLEAEPVSAPSDKLREQLLEAFDRGPQRERKVIPIGIWIGALATAAAALFALFFWVLPGAEKATPDVALRKNGPESAQQSSDTQQPALQNAQTPVTPSTTLSETAGNPESPSTRNPEEEQKTMFNEVLMEDVGDQYSSDNQGAAPTPERLEQEATLSSNSPANDFNRVSDDVPTLSDFQERAVESSGLAKQKKDSSKEAFNASASLGANPNLLSVLVTIY